MMDRLIFVEKMKEAMTEFWLVFFIKRCCLWRGPRKDNASCWIINPVVLNKSGLALLYFLN